MRRLAEIQYDLQDVAAAIAHAERTVAKHPNVPSVLATLRTIQKRRENLEEQFAAAADEVGFDLCSYRIEFEDQRQATIAAITAALNSFQKIFTSVYHAITNGPKKTAKVSAESLDATAFGFAYTFPGSIGFMMTLANERLLIDKTPLDEAMGRTFELISAESKEKIEAMTEIVGLPAVRQTLQWATENAKARLGADIVWQRSQDAKLEVRVQPKEISRLAGALSVAIAKENGVYVGELTQVNMTEKTFEMVVDGKPIRGTFDKAISASNPVQLPKYYAATMTISTKVAAVENEPDTSYFLVRLEEPRTTELPVIL
ncbi:hypothetical protein A1351_02675 [Methylosinus sp. R-45379]|uniref:hypothetical protein n=1 Tax=Methylosinus sp. R-45379 TaxID=980563 RepID=UPI0007D794EC|nr:hypothetical protein [Methylosinus sp. R-45379]OAI24903.1 hypothetical protein A1351_02675 [Methylosinus sp. R-45379]